MSSLENMHLLWSGEWPLWQTVTGGLSKVFAVILGTGVGAGYVVDGKLVEGRSARGTQSLERPSWRRLAGDTAQERRSRSSAPLGGPGGRFEFSEQTSSERQSRPSTSSLEQPISFGRHHQKRS